GNESRGRRVIKNRCEQDLRVASRLFNEFGRARTVRIIGVEAVDVRSGADVEASSRREHTQATSLVELHHDAGLNVESVLEKPRLPARIHDELLADDKVGDHDERKRLEEGVILHAAEGRRIIGVIDGVSGLDEAVALSHQVDAVKAVLK